MAFADSFNVNFVIRRELETILRSHMLLGIVTDSK